MSGIFEFFYIEKSRKSVGFDKQPLALVYLFDIIALKIQLDENFAQWAGMIINF